MTMPSLPRSFAGFRCGQGSDCAGAALGGGGGGGGTAFGSSTYVSVKREDVVAHLKEVIDATPGGERRQCRTPRAAASSSA